MQCVMDVSFFLTRPDLHSHVGLRVQVHQHCFVSQCMHALVATPNIILRAISHVAYTYSNTINMITIISSHSE